MAQVAVIAAVVSLATTVYAATQQYGAAGDAEDIGKRNAEFQIAETEEEARRLEENQSREQSRARARAAASGIDLDESESYNLVIEDLADTQREELDWLRKSGYRRARILEDEGTYASDRAKAGAYGSLGTAFGQVSNVYGAGQSAKWWK